MYFNSISMAFRCPVPAPDTASVNTPLLVKNKAGNKFVRATIFPGPGDAASRSLTFPVVYLMRRLRLFVVSDRLPRRDVRLCHLGYTQVHLLSPATSKSTLLQNHNTNQ